MAKELFRGIETADSAEKAAGAAAMARAGKLAIPFWMAAQVLNWNPY